MLALERASASLRSLPRLTQAGLATVAGGLVVDVLAHVGWSAALAAGHLVTLAGMVLAVAGVVALAFRRQASSAGPEQEVSG